jgi:hypothetical protein
MGMHFHWSGCSALAANVRMMPSQTTPAPSRVSWSCSTTHGEHDPRGRMGRPTISTVMAPCSSENSVLQPLTADSSR